MKRDPASSPLKLFVDGRRKEGEDRANAENCAQPNPCDELLPDRPLSRYVILGHENPSTAVGFTEQQQPVTDIRAVHVHMFAKPLSKLGRG